MSKKKYTKLGAVLKGEYGPFVVTGNPENGKEEYRNNVEFRVTKLDGSEVAYGKNAILTLSDPRKRPGITEEQAARIPDKVLYELLLVEKE